MWHAYPSFFFHPHCQFPASLFLLSRSHLSSPYPAVPAQATVPSIPMIVYETSFFRGIAIDTEVYTREFSF